MVGETRMNLVYDAGHDYIKAHIDAQIEAHTEATERLAARALVLTPRSRWAHLQLVYGSDEFGFYDPWAAPAVACSWPDPIPGSPMAVRARLSAGEG